MKWTTLGRTGLHISVLGFGAAEVGFLQVEQEKTTNILNFVLDAGVNVIDTAASYQGSEELVGQSIGNRRDEYVLISKCGGAMPDLPAPAWSAELVKQTVDRSLKRLRTSHLDVMLLHSCDIETLKKGEAIGALVEAQKAGKVRFVGYSGDNEAAAWAARQPEVSVIETSVSIADQANIDTVLPVAMQNGVGVLAKRAIANAAWKPVSQQPGFYGEYASTYHKRLAAMIKIQPVELGFTSSNEQAWPEIALRFTLSQPGVCCAIIGTTRVENARANIVAAAKGKLSENIVSYLRKAFSDAERSSGEKWLGET